MVGANEQATTLGSCAWSNNWNRSGLTGGVVFMPVIRSPPNVWQL